jgi:hypothetical protein
VGSVVFNVYPVSDTGERQFNDPTDKTSILVELPDSNSSVIKYNLSEEVNDGDYYTIEVSGNTDELRDDNGNVIRESFTLKDCKLFLVDFGPLQVDLKNPASGYTSEPGSDIIFSTNRRATCKISTSTKRYADMNVMTTTGEYEHRNIHPGSSPFYVVCQDEIDEVSREFDVILDTTPPLTPLVDDSTTVEINPEKSILSNSLRLKVSTNDTESGIDILNISIVEKISGLPVLSEFTTNVVNDWVAVTENDAGNALRLQDNMEYKFVVLAKNKAGLWSLPGESNGVEVDTSFNPDLSSLNVCENGQQDPGEIYLDCAGRCPGCDDGHVCSENEHCRSRFCDPEENVCKAASCDDGYLNGDEGDIDCGASCETLCDIDQTCGNNDDCSTGLCLEGICSETSCDDGLRNGDETDIDCGGSCSEKCALGESCNTPFDCESGSCSFSGVCEIKKAPVEEEKDSPLVPILIFIGVLGALGGGGYYVYLNKDTLIPMIKNLIGNSQTVQQPQVQAQQPQQQQPQVQAQQPQQQNVAATISRDMKQKEQERKREDLFGSFSSGSQASSSQQPQQESSDSTITKKDIDNLFGGMDSL